MEDITEHRYYQEAYNKVADLIAAGYISESEMDFRIKRYVKYLEDKEE